VGENTDAAARDSIFLRWLLASAPRGAVFPYSNNRFRARRGRRSVGESERGVI
jgi:hypothetical protein